MIDGQPVPKVIDFGVAKAIGGNLVEETMTQFGAVVGTLEYMSPEQAAYSGDDVDTRSDIYSLGVMLYELLTGLRPIDKARLRKAALTEMIRIIREEEPSKPSTRFSTDDALPTLAAVRQTDPKKLTAMLRGELDWVVMKRLEKNRDRRYETANGLLRDIQRYLTDEPVEARSPSTGYRLRKFLKRNKRTTVAAALVLLALVSGIAGTSFGLIRAEHQRAQANALPQAGRGTSPAKHNPTIRELLDRVATELTELKIEENFPGQPLVQAEILSTVGMSYRGIGEYEPAVEFMHRAWVLRNSVLGPNHVDTLKSMGDLGYTHLYAGNWKLAQAQLEDCLELCENALEPEHPLTVNTMDLLATTCYESGFLKRARPLAEKSLQIRRRVHSEEHPQTILTMNKLAYAHSGNGVRFMRASNERMATQRIGRTSEKAIRNCYVLGTEFVGWLAGKYAISLTAADELRSLIW